jgi:protein-tyrosine phosphatase
MFGNVPDVANTLFYPSRQIVPGLWVGSAADAQDSARARQRKIRLVVNCSKDIPATLASGTVTVLRVPIDDWTGEADVLLGHLPDAVQAIDAALERGHGVLVHCYAGMQRSAAVVAAYLMWRHGYPAREAMKRVRLAKPEAFTPRPTFGKALLRWQRALTADQP